MHVRDEQSQVGEVSREPGSHRQGAWVERRELVDSSTTEHFSEISPSLSSSPYSVVTMATNDAPSSSSPLWLALVPRPYHSDHPRRAVATLSTLHSTWAPSSALHPNTLSLLSPLFPGPFFNSDPGICQIPIFLQETV